METHEREYLVSQIIYGGKIIEFKDLTLIVKPLTIEQQYFAQRVFKKVYDEALLSGVYTKDEILEVMKDQGVWSDEEEEEIEQTRKSMENVKVEIYKSFFNPSKREKIRDKLKELQKKQFKLLSKKHANDQNNCEGIATYAKWNWVIENSTYTENDDKYDFSDFGVATVLRKYNENNLDLDQFRELARTDPWRSIWAASPTPESVFKRAASEMSPDQQNLLSWTRLYDSFAESSEMPSDEIVNDDDAIDGWLIEQRRKREKDKNKFKLDGYDDKHQGADEVYVMASSKEEAAEVYNMNDAQGRMTVKSREKTVKEADGEHVNHRDFRDVKIKALNAANAKFGK